MSNDTALEKIQPPNPEAPSPIGVTEALKRSNRPFNHELFRQRLTALRHSIVETGGIVFFPIVWGSPHPEEQFTEDNQLVVKYDPDHLTTYPLNTLRDPVPHLTQVGPFIAYDYKSEPDPMRVRDVEERVRMVQNFERLRFPTKQNRFNQMNGITIMTDVEGNVSVSLNCPYPLRLGEESSVRGDSTLPVTYPEDSFTTRVYYAAYLRVMGCDDKLIYGALAVKPRPASAEIDGTYVLDEAREILTALNRVPSLGSYFVYDSDTHELRWTPPKGITATPKDVYRTILTTAHFQDNGNVRFEIIPKPLQIKQLR